METNASWKSYKKIGLNMVLELFVMLRVCSVSKLPNVSAVYVLYGGKDLVYVGATDKLRNRIEQHLVRRDSSIATQTSAVSLNPDYVSEVRWWSTPCSQAGTSLRPRSWRRLTFSNRSIGAEEILRRGRLNSAVKASFRGRCDGSSAAKLQGS